MIGQSIEHQGRELLHGIAMLTRCLELPGTNATRRRQWQARIRKARVDLEALYAEGLQRDFRIRPEVPMPAAANQAEPHSRHLTHAARTS